MRAQKNKYPFFSGSSDKLTKLLLFFLKIQGAIKKQQSHVHTVLYLCHTCSQFRTDN